jgi:hypothetical protein
MKESIIHEEEFILSRRKKTFFTLLTAITIACQTAYATPQEDADAVAAQAAGQSQSSAESAPAATQLPNPIVTYSSDRELAEAVGFHPLILPLSAGYECTDRFSISGDLAELRYTSRYGLDEKKARVEIRTARLANLTNAGGSEAEKFDISGIYGLTWNRIESASGPVIYLARAGEDQYAAHWTQGGYAFSCWAANLNEWEFKKLLLENLIDLTNHYYRD